jgi:predicted nuclease of predicted toxin-antitoxin system
MASDDDDSIFDRAALEGRILISADTDFGTILASRKAERPSIVLFRRSAQRRPYEQVSTLLSNLNRISPELTPAASWSSSSEGSGYDGLPTVD